jgi:DNA-binding NtrC family response regulator
MAMQAKLLRFLENRRFMRVGGSTKIQADVRLLCATLRPLAEEVAASRFRADLFYRIQGITFNVPALRERRADIAPLLSQFLAQLSARHGVQPPKLTRQAKSLLLQYDWPGNVRELRNVIETLCLLKEGRQVRPTDLPDEIRRQFAASAGPPATDRASELVLDLGDGLESLTSQIIEAALDAEGGDTLRASAKLKVSRRTLQRHLASGRVRAPARPEARVKRRRAP